MEPNPHPIDTPSSVSPSGALLVTIDRLPAWMLAAYGATWMATPALDSLAAHGVTFDRVITPSLAEADAVHGLPGGIGEDLVRLLAAGSAGGRRPMVVTDDPALAAGLAADAVLAGVGVRLVEAVAKRAIEAEDSQTNIARLVDAAVEVIASGEHRLVWCHIGSLGVAWDAPEAFRERYVDPEDPPPPDGASVPAFAVDADTDPDLIVGIRHVFAGQVTLLDNQLGRLFAAAQESSAAGRPWTVLVVGLRGLPLGLHGWVGLGGPELPYGELVHVPAILVDADGRMAAQRFGGLIVPADLMSTLMELMDMLVPTVGPLPYVPAIDAESPWRAVSLATLFLDWSAPVRDRVVVMGHPAAAVVTPDWFGVLSGGRDDGAGTTTGHTDQFRLFSKPDDYFEQANVADRCHDAAERLGAVARLALAGDVAGAWLANIVP